MTADQRRMVYLALVMAVACAAVGTFTIAVLYRERLASVRAELLATVQGHARLIESVARHGAEQARAYPEHHLGSARDDTLAQIIEAEANFMGYGETGEFTLAERQGDQLVFQFRHRHDSTETPASVPVATGLAEPTRRALDGQSGTVIGPDYRGVTVVAAYEPVAILNMGLVAKIDLAEVKAPFERSSALAVVIGVLLVIVGALLFHGMTSPIIARLEAHTFELQAEMAERKQIQHELEKEGAIAQKYLDVANVMFVIIDNDGRVTLLNQKACEILGCSEDEALGKDWFDNFLPAEDRDETKDVFRSLMRGEAESAEYYENLVVTASGEERVIAWRNTTLTDEDGTLMGTLSSGEDITERRQAEEAVHALNEELEQRVAERTSELMAVNHELESFAYSVSHDLRAPLRSVDGFSAALIEDYGETLDDVAKDYVQRIRFGAQHMGQLIDDLLTLSRVTRSEMSREAVDLSGLANEVGADMRELEPDRDVDFAVEPGVTGYGDLRLLRVLLTNLVGNAWKFTGKKASATIEFGANETDGEAIYYVRDNGAGFDMTYVHKLFRPFQRLHRVDEFPGTGIGLATARRIINRHGGRLWAEGEIGKGATIYFTLQRERAGKDEGDE